MTELMIRILQDCVKKTNGVTPTEEEKKYLLDTVKMLDREGKLLDREDIDSVRLEIREMKGTTAAENYFIRGLEMYFQDVELDEIANGLAADYLLDSPQRWESVCCFMCIWAAVEYVQKNADSTLVLDDTLEYLLPEDMQWTLKERQEDWAEDEMRERGEEPELSWTFAREKMLGDTGKEVSHRFDDVELNKLWKSGNPETIELAKQVGERIITFGDGAGQEILKQMPLATAGLAVRALPDEAYDYVCGNVEDDVVNLWKRDFFLLKDEISEQDILAALNLLNGLMDAYEGDTNLEAEYY